MSAAVRPTSGALATVLGALKGVKRKGPGAWMALCPAHADGTPSLLVSEGEKGIVAHCYAGCTFADIVDASGVPRDAWFYDARETTPAVHPRGYRPGDRPAVAAPVEKAEKATRRPPTEADVVAAYDYTTADGALLYQNVRYLVDGKKDFRQRRPDDTGGWIASLGREEDGGTPRVLYRLPDVEQAAAAGRRVYLVEGEKDVETLRQAGLCATTSGSATTWRATFAAALHGADVVILPDHDGPGETYAQRALADCLAAGVAARVVHLPDLPPGGDVTDWLASGRTVAELDALCTPVRRFQWLTDVLGDEELMRPPAEIVPGIAWAGRSTLLVAREKAGKSTIGGAICAAVSQGGPWLDGMCTGGPVLVLTLEEHIADTAARLRDFGADGAKVALVQLDGITGAHGRIHELRQRIAEIQPVLVFVDSFTRVAADVVENYNQLGETAPVAYALTDLAHELGVAVVIVHHMNKAGNALGSTGITAAVDVWTDVTCPDAEADPTARMLSPRGRVRGLRPVTMRYVDEHAGGPAFRLPGGPVQLTPTERVHHYLRSHPGASLSALRERIGGQAASVDAAIKGLMRQGFVRDELSAGGHHSFSLTPAGERNR